MGAQESNVKTIKVEKPSFMYTKVTPTVNKNIYENYEPTVDTQSKGVPVVNTGWTDSMFNRKTKTATPITTKINTTQWNVAISGDNVTLSSPVEVALNVSEINQSTPIYVKYGDINIYPGGIKYEYTKLKSSTGATSDKQAYAKPNGVAQQLGVSSINTISKIAALMKTDLPLVKNASVLLSDAVTKTGKTYTPSVFNRYMFGLVDNTVTYILALIKLARIRQALIKLNGKNYYLSSKINIFLNQLDRSRFISAYNDLKLALKKAYAHADILPIMMGMYSIQNENNALNDVLSISRINWNQFFGLDDTSSGTWNGYVYENVKAKNAINFDSSQIGSTQWQLFLNVVSGGIAMGLSLSDMRRWAIELPDVEDVIDALYSDEACTLPWSKDKYSWPEYCQSLILAYIEHFNQLSIIVPVKLQDYDDFFTLVNLLPEAFMSKIQTGIDIDAIFMAPYIKKDNGFELLNYAHLIQWTKGSESTTNSVSGLINDDTIINESTDSLINAIVPMFNNLYTGGI